MRRVKPFGQREILQKVDSSVRNTATRYVNVSMTCQVTFLCAVVTVLGRRYLNILTMKRTVAIQIDIQPVDLSLNSRVGNTEQLEVYSRV